MVSITDMRKHFVILSVGAEDGFRCRKTVDKVVRSVNALIFSIIAKRCLWHAQTIFRFNLRLLSYVWDGNKK